MEQYLKLGDTVFAAVIGIGVKPIVGEYFAMEPGGKITIRIQGTRQLTSCDPATVFKTEQEAFILGQYLAGADLIWRPGNKPMQFVDWRVRYIRPNPHHAPYKQLLLITDKGQYICSKQLRPASQRAPRSLHLRLDQFPEPNLN